MRLQAKKDRQMESKFVRILFALAAVTAVAAPVGFGLVLEKERQDLLVAWAHETSAVGVAASKLRTMLAPVRASSIRAFERGPGAREDHLQVIANCETHHRIGHIDGAKFNGARAELWPVAMRAERIRDLVDRIAEHTSRVESLEAHLQLLGSTAPDRLDRTPLKLAEKWQQMKPTIARVARSKPVDALATVVHRNPSVLCL